MSVMRITRRKSVAVVLLLAVSIFTSNAKADGSPKRPQPEPKRPEAHVSIPQQYVVKLKKPIPAANQIQTLANIEDRLGSRVKEVIRPNLILIERNFKEARANALSELRANSAVAEVDPNYILKAYRAPNDADYKKLWGLKNSGEIINLKRALKGLDLSAERAWDITTGSKAVVVAVIDTGIDFSHPDLKPNAWVNEKELNGTSGVDDDGNGYVDDIHGYDFVNNDGDPTDDQGHGSHCAGTIGARGDDGSGVAGVNWNVSLMAVKFLDANGSGSLADAIKAIDYARINNARILSNSWGGGPKMSTLEDAIELTRQAGLLFVAAAGNNGSDNEVSPAYPASFDADNIMSVAAIDARGDLADFSNYGATRVDIAAPGVAIYSTVPGGFETFSGTSMATPHVAGVAALLLAAEPNLTYQELKEKILLSARPLRSLQGQILTGGILDAYHALSGEPPPADPNDVSTWNEKSVYSLSTTHPYPDDANLNFKIHVPGAKRLSVHFSKFESEKGYDLLQFSNGAGEVVGVWSGTKENQFSPIVDGETLILNFTSDSTVNGYGFDIDSVSVER